MRYTTHVETVHYCPKCDSEDVKINPVNIKKERVSMDALTKESSGYGCDTLEMRYYRYRAVCCNCGYSVEFTRS